MLMTDVLDEKSAGLEALAAVGVWTTSASTVANFAHLLLHARRKILHFVLCEVGGINAWRVVCAFVLGVIVVEGIKAWVTAEDSACGFENDVVWTDTRHTRGVGMCV